MDVMIQKRRKMKNKISNRWINLLFLLILALLLTGCKQASDEPEAKIDPIDPFNFYKQIELGDSKDDVDTLFDVDPIEKEGSYTYVDPDGSFGVMIVYDSGNTVFMKTLYNEDESQIMSLSDAKVTEDQVDSILEGMSYKEVKSLLGTDGIEIIEMTNPADLDKPIYMFIWFNPDNTGIYGSFLGDKGTVVNAVYFE